MLYFDIIDRYLPVQDRGDPEHCSAQCGRLAHFTKQHFYFSNL